MNTRYLIIYLLIYLPLLPVRAYVDSDHAQTPAPDRYRLVIEGTIAEVLAGDTFRLDSGVLIRLAGVDCYEPIDMGWVDVINPFRFKFANIAKEKSEQLVLNKTLQMEIVNDFIPDINNRKQVYLYTEKGKTLNEELLRLGLAQILPGTPAHPLNVSFKTTQNQAIAEQIGIHSIDWKWINASLRDDKETNSLEFTAETEIADESPFSMYRQREGLDTAKTQRTKSIPQNMNSDNLTILFGTVILSSFIIGLVVSYVLATATKKCKNCGAENSISEQFCSTCGQEFKHRWSFKRNPR